MTDPANKTKPSLTPHEIREALQAFGLSAATLVRAFVPSSSAAPMALIEAGGQRYLLKRRRRVEGCVDPDLVQSEHAIQRYLEREGVQTASLPSDRATVCSTPAFIYEIFRFLDAAPAHPSEHQAHIAGELLARIHASHGVSFARRDSRWGANLKGGMHLNQVFERGPLDHPSLGHAIRGLEADFNESLHACEGSDLQRPTLVHGDYHPANLLWDRHRPREKLDAVIDFEGAGRGDPARELASGALFFSLDTRAASPSGWAEAPDSHRLAAFVRGYASIPRAPSVGTGIEPDAQPWYMIQQLAWQTLPRLYSDQGFGRHTPAEVVTLVSRVSAWIREHEAGLAQVIADEFYNSRKR